MEICMRERKKILGSASFQVWSAFPGSVYANKQISDSLRLRLKMEPYSEEAAKIYPLNKNDDWLRKRQGLALPILPPTTPEAWNYFFKQVRRFADEASLNGKQKIDFENFAQEWNQTADGNERFYVTVEVLSNYAKSWEKVTNIRASEELIADQLSKIRMSRQIFAAPNTTFPAYLTSNATQIHPSQGVVDYLDSETAPSLSTSLPLSRSCQPKVNEATHNFTGFLSTESASTQVGGLTMEQNPEGSLQRHMSMDWQAIPASDSEIQTQAVLLPILWVLFLSRRCESDLPSFLEEKTMI